MSSSAERTGTTRSNLSNNAQLGFVTAPTRSSDRNKHRRRQPATHQSITRDYVPNATPIFEALHKLEKRAVKSAKHFASFVETHIMVCRVYYAFLFHIQLLRARNSANQCELKELAILGKIDEKVHLASLPIHEEMIDVFRLHLPGISSSVHGIGLSPCLPHPPRFTEIVDPVTNQTRLEYWITSCHTQQPSIRIGINYLRWVMNKQKIINDENFEVNVSERLDYIVNGKHTVDHPSLDESRYSNPDLLAVLMKNSIFRYPIPVKRHGPPCFYENVQVIEVPSPLETFSATTDILDALSNELLTEDPNHWLNYAKYIVATICHMTSAVYQLSDLDAPLSKEEVQASISHLDGSESPDHDSDYLTYLQWLSLDDEHEFDNVQSVQDEEISPNFFQTLFLDDDQF